MLLAIDIGNSTIVIGVFRERALVGEWRIVTSTARSADEYGVLLEELLRTAGLTRDGIDGVILSSVVPPLTPVFEEMAGRYCRVPPVVVSSELDHGLVLGYDLPRDVGADRIVNAVAARARTTGPVIVVDFGTATTFDVVTGTGEYLGGAIAPGLEISAEALFRRTAKLPKVELARPKAAIGRHTTASLQSGLIFGYAGLVDALVRRITTELGADARVIATGGLAGLVAADCQTIHEVVPTLTLDGLRLLYERNRP